MTEVRFVDAEVLRVGPDEVLIVRLPGDIVEHDGLLDEITEELRRLLGHRFSVYVGDVEFVVAK